MQTLQEYLNKTLSLRTLPRTITIPTGRLIKVHGFQICAKTKKLGQTGWGYRRSCQDEPILCHALGSFITLGGGGYFVRREDNDKIIQVQSFHTQKLQVEK
jgi:hypothetical protein